MSDFAGAIDLVKALTNDIKEKVDGLHAKTDISIGNVHKLDDKVAHL